MTDAAHPGITCSRYRQPASGKRCAHYRSGGLCAGDGTVLEACVEWVRVNGDQGASVETPVKAAPTRPMDRDLFGTPIQAERSRRGSKRRTLAKATAQVATAATPATSTKPPVVRNVTDEEIASFRALGAEVCIRSEEVGEVWVVPEYTGSDRAELSVEHSITLATICAVFPGAKVVAMNRRGG